MNSILKHFAISLLSFEFEWSKAPLTCKQNYLGYLRSRKGHALIFFFINSCHPRQYNFLVSIDYLPCKKTRMTKNGLINNELFLICFPIIVISLLQTFLVICLWYYIVAYRCSSFKLITSCSNAYLLIIQVCFL